MDFSKIFTINEATWLFYVVINFSVILLAYRKWGRVGLLAFTPISIILANVQVSKLVILFGVETTLGNIKFTKSTSTEIYDESLIDSRFIEVVTTEKISKEKIKAALKAGEKLQGARLVENKNLKIG